MPVTAFRYTSEESEIAEKGSDNVGYVSDFEQLFKGQYVKLTLFANRFLNDADASEEIVSDAFTWLWEQRQHLKINSSVQSYMYRMVQNRCLNYLKHKKIENEYVSYLQRNNLLAEHLSVHSDSFNEKEFKEQVNIAVEGLPPRCREIFKLSRFRHLKNKEIARVLDISPKAVERQMTIALDKLRHCLKHFLPLIIGIFFS